MNRILFLLPVILLWATTGLSQAPAGFRHLTRYTTAQGLSDNVVSGIAEDSIGFLWLTTRSGLNRFNGHRFIQYHSTDDPASLPDEETMGICRLDEHRIAVVGSGVHIVNTRTGEQRNLFVPYKDHRYVFKFNMSRQAIGDKAGNIFVLTRSGFYHFAPNDSLVFRFDYYPDSLMPINHLVFGGRVMQLDANRLMIASIGGLYLYNIREKIFRLMQPGDSPPLASFLLYPTIHFEFLQLQPGRFLVFDPVNRSLTHVDLNKDNRLFTVAWPRDLPEIGWRSKLLEIDSLHFLVNLQQAGIARINFSLQNGSLPSIASESELKEYVCNDMLKDHTNRLLIATNKGLLREDGSPAVQTVRIDVPAAHPDASLDDVVRIGDKVYAATHGAGLAVLHYSGLQFEKMINLGNDSAAMNHVTALVAMPDQRLFIGTMSAPLIFDPRTERITALDPPEWIRSNYWVHNINSDRKDHIWISAHRIYRYNLLTGAFDMLPDFPKLLDAPVAIEEDRQGNIWMARHGLARFNVQRGKYDRYIDSFPFIKMPDKQVSAFTIDADNTIWMSVRNNGLIAYAPGSGSFRQFTRKDGLLNDQISALYYLNDKVWIAGYAGISSIDVSTYQIQNYGPQDGFPSSPVNRGSRFFYDSTDHQLYIGFADAVARFDPSVVGSPAAAPHVFIESVIVDGSKTVYLPGNTLSTSWNDRQLRITIGAINFFDGSMQQFAYRFVTEGNEPWIELGADASFSVSGLSRGHHLLEVRVSSGSNRWLPQVIGLAIEVGTPFWLSPSFLIGYCVLLTWLVYRFIRWRTSVARRKEMVNTQIEKLRADDYKAQFELEQITHYFSSALAGKTTEEAVLTDVAARLIGRMEYEDCIIYLWNSDRTKMIQRAAHGPKGEEGSVKFSGFEVEPGQGIVGQVMITQKPMLIDDTRQDERYRVDDCFRLSELTVPIMHNGELLGVIDSEHSEAGYFNERDIKIMTTIATLLGNKLKQLESEQSLQAKQQELAGINEQLAEAKLSALQAQMNPHFVFNALNSIKRLILEGDNDRASRYLSKFALMIRMTLEHSKETFITLYDHLQYLKAYLEMERLRFDQTFRYTIEMEEAIDASEIVLPSMMIQPLVENAIWHGLMYAEGGKQLDICFTVSNHRIRCVVEDNGIGIRRSEQLRRESRAVHRSVGLENLRKRIHIMNEKYGTDCTLTITDLSEKDASFHGTRATLELNII